MPVVPSLEASKAIVAASPQDRTGTAQIAIWQHHDDVPASLRNYAGNWVTTVEIGVASRRVSSLPEPFEESDTA